MSVVQQVAHQLALDSLLSRPIGELSGGQRQRVFIGRCLAQEPAALLLDEPNTFLDLRHQVELMGILKHLARQQKIAILMASHDLNLSASSADRMVLLQDGSVVSDGPPAKVLDPGLLTQVYGVEMRRIDPADGAPPVVYPTARQDLDADGATT
jgi:iron complex transport system ATP-binding protein